MIDKGRYDWEDGDIVILDRPSEDKRFDPSQPRDEHGKWTDGGGSDDDTSGGPSAFISPNVSTLTFQEAQARLSSPSQHLLVHVSNQIDEKVGIKSINTSAIGAWSDGAENSIIVRSPNASMAQMRAASVMKGHLADQKSVLVFNPDVDSGHFMARFDFSHTAENLHSNLLQAGLEFHTLEPVGDGTVRVHIFGEDQSYINAIAQAAEDLGDGSEVTVTPGTGEFIGTKLGDEAGDRAQRDDARRVYEETIRQISDSGELEAGRIWDEVSDNWRAEAEAIEEEAIEFAQGESKPEVVLVSEPPSEEARPGPRTSYAVHRTMVENTMNEVVKERGYDPSLVTISDGTENVMMGGKVVGKSAGMANVSTGEIILFPRLIHDQQNARGVAVHEIAHQEFETVLNAYRAEVKQAENDPDVKFEEDLFVLPDEGKYPILARMQNHEADAWEARITTDGVTPYSEQWWTEAYVDHSKLLTAQHETIAEMARIEDETGKLPGAPNWVSFYNDVMQAYKELKGKK